MIKRAAKFDTGFYEVQTGQTIGQIHLNILPKNLAWMGGLLARNLWALTSLNPNTRAG